MRRQREDWQRQATRELATGRTADGAGALRAAGMVQGTPPGTEAKAALVAGWDAARQETARSARARSCWRTGATTCGI